MMIILYVDHIAWTFGTSPEPSIEKKYVVKFDYEIYKYEWKNMLDKISTFSQHVSLLHLIKNVGRFDEVF